MSKERNTELLMVASQALRLKDIALFECHLARGKQPDGAPPLVLHHKRGVQFVRTKSSPDAKFDDQLQVGVRLGYRVVDETAAEPQMVFEIEAEFAVSYTFTADIAEEAIQAFANLNCAHIVWPFWRQHVFDTVARARLPQFEVPLLSGTRL